jgi:hypothetical protein
MHLRILDLRFEIAGLGSCKLYIHTPTSMYAYRTGPVFGSSASQSVRAASSPASELGGFKQHFGSYLSVAGSAFAFVGCYSE